MLYQVHAKHVWKFQFQGHRHWLGLPRGYLRYLSSAGTRGHHSSPDFTESCQALANHDRSSYDKFVSVIESRIQENGELYGKYQLGTFVEGQALTVANALRRTLLSEIPGFVLTSLQIENVNHEFATLPGVKENVLSILLNLKRMAITAQFPTLNVKDKFFQEFQGSLAVSGPKEIKAGDIYFPKSLGPVNANHYIATISTSATLKLDFSIQLIDPIISGTRVYNPKKEKNRLVLNTIPKPVRQVNYSIHEDLVNNNGSYISLEIRTDGSIHPTQVLECALERLTRIFYELTQVHKKTLPHVPKAIEDV